VLNYKEGLDSIRRASVKAPFAPFDRLRTGFYTSGRTDLPKVVRAWPEVSKDIEPYIGANGAQKL